ncbi:MAG TPA: anti-sigma factor [Ilumatobacter sp.]|nr:anti-sigma factor [Ilumatobacter sp.]
MSNDLHHLAAAYALDALDEVERSAFEAHYPSCEICQQEVTEFRSTAVHLAAATAATPPTSLKASVMAEVNTTRQVPPGAAVAGADELTARRSRRFASVLAAAAAVVALVGAAVFVAATRGGSEIDDVVAAPDAQITQLERVTQLEGEVGSIRLVWSPSRDQLVFYGNDLPDPGEGKVYELWAISEEAGALSAGLFDPVEGTVRQLVDVGDVEPTAWGITIEPEGGSPVATTDVIYFAEV